MKIGVFAGTITGIVGFRLDMMKAFIARGHEIVAVSGFEKPHLRDVLDAGGIRFIGIDIDRKSVNPLKEFSLIRELKSILNAEKFDAVIAFTPKMATYTAIAAKFSGIKKRVAVFTGLGFAFTSEKFFEKLAKLPFRFIYGLGMHCATDVLFQNPDDMHIAESLGMSNAAKDKLMNGSGVNLEKFPYSDAPRGEISFVFVGRLTKHKGVREFIYAAKKIKARHPNVRFVMIGSVDNNPASIGKDEFEKIKSGGEIECTGFVSDVAKYVSQCSVAVLPSYREGCPRSMLEAMSIGRALILADSVGTRVPINLTDEGRRQQSQGEPVMIGENGFLVRPRDGDALAEAMERFIENPELVSAMGKRSREIAEEKFDVDKVNAFLLSIIE